MRIDTQTLGCDPTRCSVGVQWDEHTAVSVELISRSNGLDPAASLWDLVAVAESLEPSATLWLRGALEEFLTEQGACVPLPGDLLPLVVTDVPTGYELAFARYEASPEGTYSAAMYEAAGGPELGGSRIWVISCPTPMWDIPVVTDDGPFELRDASKLEGGTSDYRAVGFEFDGPHYVTVDSDGEPALSFTELASVADSLFAQCSAYEPGPLTPD